MEVWHKDTRPGLQGLRRFLRRYHLKREEDINQEGEDNRKQTESDFRVASHQSPQTKHPAPQPRCSAPRPGTPRAHALFPWAHPTSRPAAWNLRQPLFSGRRGI